MFTQTYRSEYLAQLPTEGRRKILCNLYDQLDALGRQRQTAQDLMEELGRSYLEIVQFQQLPGSGLWALIYSVGSFRRLIGLGPGNSCGVIVGWAYLRAVVQASRCPTNALTIRGLVF